MTRAESLKHQFVDRIPDHLEDGTLYVSIPRATAAHRCGCGCGNEVVTPLSPTDWKLVFDGETVSLSPSIGNWSFACQSHYWIVRGRLRWMRRWSAAEIQRGRDRDRLAKELHLATARPVGRGPDPDADGRPPQKRPVARPPTR